MNLLLDTHVILWIAFNEEKVSKTVKNLVLSSYSQIFISAISFWEISIKYQMGKLNLGPHTPSSLLEGFKNYFDHYFLDLNAKESATFYQLQTTHHRDPFDRMLVWQALNNGLDLISNDELVKQYEDTGLKIIW
ncbi:type II toxin-antitoxin system VapC family toxin [Algoriphagus namhaensis]